MDDFLLATNFLCRVQLLLIKTVNFTNTNLNCVYEHSEHFR